MRLRLLHRGYGVAAAPVCGLLIWTRPRHILCTWAVSLASQPGRRLGHSRGRLANLLLGLGEWRVRVGCTNSGPQRTRVLLETVHPMR